MSQYFYAVATLPLLSFDQDQVPSTVEFLEMCRAHMTAEDFDLLSSARLVPEGTSVERPLEFETLLDGPEVVNYWLSWESRLRDELVRLRAQKLELEASRYLSDTSYVGGVYDTAREAVGAASPLAAEEILDRARWQYLDELETGHYFDVVRIIVYYIRLQILERRSLLKRDLGEGRFAELYSAVMPKTISEQFGQTNVGSEG